MRLFTAVELDARLRAASAEIARGIRRRIDEACPELRARWIPDDNLHVTLAFIGEVPEARVPGIVSALEASFATPVFTLGIAGSGVFPASGHPRVIWLGVSEGTMPLAGLYADVTARLEPLGVPPERRPYHAHLTIARLAAAPRRDFAAIRRIVTDQAVDAGACAVGHLTLFRSRLSPRGAAYEPVLRVPLKT
jgi:RNA 2',3'-cyclic 3'-phosphodiesterase